MMAVLGWRQWLGLNTEQPAVALAPAFDHGPLDQQDVKQILTDRFMA